MKRFKNTTITDERGKLVDVVMPDGVKALTVKEIFWLILNNAPYQSQQDSINGMKLATALDHADEYVIIAEEDVYEWLKSVSQRVTPPLFKLLGNTIYRHICNGYEKEE